MNAPLIPGSMRFEIDVLKTFIAVADTGSVKLASERVARSSAAVSMQMKKLEGLIGAPVFQRSDGAMRLSAAGERLVPHAHRIVQAHDTAVSELHSPDIEGEVRVGICLENAETRMPEILAGFSKAHSRVTVEIISGDAQDLAAMLAKKELDVAILTIGGGAPPDERDRLLHEQPLVWAAHRNGQRSQERPLRLAVASVGCPWRLAALDAPETCWNSLSNCLSFKCFRIAARSDPGGSCSGRTTAQPHYKLHPAHLCERGPAQASIHANRAPNRRQSERKRKSPCSTSSLGFQSTALSDGTWARY